MKSEVKYKLAPIDLNLPITPFYHVNKRGNDKPEAYENADKTIGLNFFKGRPSTQAEKIICYLSSKIPRKSNGEIDTEQISKSGILFTCAELCRYLGIKNTTINRRAIQKDLIKLGYITIYYHKKFVVNKGGQENTCATIEQVQPFKVSLFDLEKNDKVSQEEQLPLWYNQIKFDPVILKNLDNGIFRLININDLRRIKSYTATRIYTTIVSLHNQSKVWKIGLNKLANLIPLENKYQWKKKHTIVNALMELKDLDLIADYEIYTNSQKEEIIQFTFKEEPNRFFPVREIKEQRIDNLYRLLIKGARIN